MTHDEAIQQLRELGRARVFGRHVGSDRLVRAGLDALTAGVDSPSLALLAGLLRSEEPEAPELFDQVLDELGLLYRPPAGFRAARWDTAYWIAGQIVDGTLDPASGAQLIWAEVAEDLGQPEDLRPLVAYGIMLDDWTEEWDVSAESLRAKTVEAAGRFLRERPPGERTD
ncbi:MULTISPECIES: hypothetical protein [unclassified Streptomyces]|uniref:hypothetical protein n=1 Tax=unclassified Streptomyces TaxID=2593676 RepID=UPI0006FB7099|nr:MULTISPECIES: hypothetical protein [unclassified Streptomyces]KQX56294.1 hypothetical protein ASD33_30080 [Streptomyces sp. Root1304]KRA97109.1 hypothetical protein ASE09_26890 [Streptomyces sp. Root66D1]